LGGPSPSTAKRSQRRTELRRLDACLSVLEDALAEDREVLDEAGAERLRTVLPTLRAGMSVRAAMHMVWRQQGVLLRGEAPTPIPPPSQQQRIQTVILW
jgi:hypothetical protein